MSEGDSLGPQLNEPVDGLPSFTLVAVHKANRTTRVDPFVDTRDFEVHPGRPMVRGVEVLDQVGCDQRSARVVEKLCLAQGRTRYGDRGQLVRPTFLGELRVKRKVLTLLLKPRRAIGSRVRIRSGEVTEVDVVK